jgi:hypothetical protein
MPESLMRRDAVADLARRNGAVYKMVGPEERFRSMRHPDIGHRYTAEMRKEMLAWFE